MNEQLLNGETRSDIYQDLMSAKPQSFRIRRRNSLTSQSVKECEQPLSGATRSETFQELRGSKPSQGLKQPERKLSGDRLINGTTRIESYQDLRGSNHSQSTRTRRRNSITTSQSLKEEEQALNGTTKRDCFQDLRDGFQDLRGSNHSSQSLRKLERKLSGDRLLGGKTTRNSSQNLRTTKSSQIVKKVERSFSGDRLLSRTTRSDSSRKLRSTQSSQSLTMKVERPISATTTGLISQDFRSSKSSQRLKKPVRRRSGDRLLGGTAKRDSSQNLMRSKSTQSLKGSKSRNVRSTERLAHGREKPKDPEDAGILNLRANKEHSLHSLNSPLQGPRSIDVLPKAPPLLMSPLGKKVLLRNSRQLDWETSNSKNASFLLENTDSSFPAPTHIESPTEKVKPSDILSRLPSHINEQFSLDQWNAILEPNKSTESKTSTLFNHTTSPTSVCQISSPPPVKPDKAYDALYCTEHRSKSPEIGDSGKPRLQESRKEMEIVGRSMERNTSTVSFKSAVTVRRYERILVVNPSTSSGPSLGIGWNYTQRTEPIDWIHQCGGDLRMSRDEREEMVKELGYSTREIACAVREGLKIKNQRRTTINNLRTNILDVQKVEYLAEKCQRKLGKLKSRFLVSEAATFQILAA